MAMLPICIVFRLLAIVGLLAPSCMAQNPNFLVSGGSLKATQMLVSQNYSLVMQTDCNLVLYHGSTSLWSTNTHGQSRGCYVRLKADGNLVLYNYLAQPLWWSNSLWTEGSYVLFLQKDGNAVISRMAGFHFGAARAQPQPASEEDSKFILSALKPPTNALYTGERLKTGESLQYGNSRITIQQDCNFVYYRGNVLRWQSSTGGKGIGCYVELQADGNPYVFDQSGTRVWKHPHVHSSEEGNYVLALMNFPEFAVYGPSRWSTNVTISIASLGACTSVHLASDRATSAVHLAGDRATSAIKST